MAVAAGQLHEVQGQFVCASAHHLTQHQGGVELRQDTAPNRGSDPAYEIIQFETLWVHVDKVSLSPMIVKVALSPIHSRYTSGDDDRRGFRRVS
jgi:hypothetical protein